MTDTVQVVAPAGGASTGATGAAATRTIQLAADVVRQWEAFFKMIDKDSKFTISYEGDNGTISYSGEEVDFKDGLMLAELEKLGINFTNNRLFDLIGAGTVIGGTNTDNAITAEEAAKFMTNVEEYAKLLGYNITDANREQVLKDVAAMYNKAGVDFRVVNEADQAAVKDAAEALKGKAGEAAKDGTALKTWTDSAKDLAATQALARAVLGVADTNSDGKTLVDELVKAWWTKVMGKGETDQITAEDLPKLYSFLSFWRNVPDEVLKGWGVTPKQLETCALNSGNNVTVVDSNKWTTWLTPAVQPQAEQEQNNSAAPFTVSVLPTSPVTVGTPITFTLTPAAGRTVAVKFRYEDGIEQTVSTSNNTYSIATANPGTLKIWVEYTEGAQTKRVNLNNQPAGDNLEYCTNVVISPVSSTVNAEEVAAKLGITGLNFSVNSAPTWVNNINIPNAALALRTALGLDEYSEDDKDYNVSDILAKFDPAEEGITQEEKTRRTKLQPLINALIWGAQNSYAYYDDEAIPKGPFNPEGTITGMQLKGAMEYLAKSMYASQLKTYGTWFSGTELDEANPALQAQYLIRNTLREKTIAFTGDANRDATALVDALTK